MGCIYMRTSPSGKSYIGQTSFPEEKRWKEHCNVAFLKSSPAYNYPLSRAIRKYGPDSFVLKILEDNIEDVETLCEREIYWISYYNTFKEGLNATIGGQGNGIQDSEAINALWDEGHCVRDICLLLNIWPTTALKHLKVSLEECKQRGPIYIAKNSSKYFGDFHTGRATPVSCYDMETGMLVKSFHSFYEAIRFVGAKNSGTIVKAANGMLKSAYGYYWRKGTEEKQLSKEYMLKIKKKEKRKIRPVLCVEKETIYRDSVYAQKITGISYRSICFSCKENHRTAGGFHWRYATKEEMDIYPVITEKFCREIKKGKSVMCIETGKIYNMIKDASEDTGSNKICISRCCKGKQKETNGLHWKYAEERDVTK